jgi:hypothetical protein
VTPSSTLHHLQKPPLANHPQESFSSEAKLVHRLFRSDQTDLWLGKSSIISLTHEATLRLEVQVVEVLEEAHGARRLGVHNGGSESTITE